MRMHGHSNEEQSGNSDANFVGPVALTAFCLVTGLGAVALSGWFGVGLIAQAWTPPPGDVFGALALGVLFLLLSVSCLVFLISVIWFDLVPLFRSNLNL